MTTSVIKYFQFPFSTKSARNNSFNTFHCKQTMIHMTHKHKCSPPAPQCLVNAMANKWRFQHSRQTKWLAVLLAVCSVFVCSVPALHSSEKCLIDNADLFPSRAERRPSGSHLHGSACIFFICYLICLFRLTAGETSRSPQHLPLNIFVLGRKSCRTSRRTLSLQGLLLHRQKDYESSDTSAQCHSI